jgi:hypothetical protein
MSVFAFLVLACSCLSALLVCPCLCVVLYKRSALGARKLYDELWFSTRFSAVSYAESSSVFNATQYKVKRIAVSVFRPLSLSNSSHLK